MREVSTNLYLLRESADHLVSDAKYVMGRLDTKFLLFIKKTHFFLKLGSEFGDVSSLCIRSVHFRLLDSLHA